MTSETEVVDALTDGDKGTIIVAKTPFYATMGGQEADKGIICTEDGEFVVEDVVKLAGGKFGHVGQVTKGMIKVGDKVTLKVDKENRALAENNHSATHLLQKALRMVLGNHVEQAGSLNNAQRLRFDFTHFSAVTPEELKKVEEIVNEQITNALAVVTKNLPIEEARKTGAQALFGEKYGDVVRVVDMSGFSVEFCGGTHVKNTSEITALKIISESGVAAGVRRIEALTSEGLMNYYAEMERLLKEAAQLVKATPENLAEKITHLQAENKSLKGEVESLKSKMAQSAAGDILDQVKEVKGVKLLAAQLDGVDMNGLRELGDNLKEKLGEGVIVLASQKDGKVFLVAMVTDEAQKAGAHAGNLIKAIAGCVGGGGGGRPNMAQAGGKNPAGIPEAVAKVKEILESQNIEKTQHFTKPPARYSEAKLIKEMEELGIGRPSTYAMIIDTIQTRGYVELVDKTFKPTESGILTSDRLTQFFNDIINVEYTAQMEKELDDIAEGQDDYFDAIDTFIKKFQPLLDEANEKMEVISPKKTGEKCPECGHDLVERHGRYGKFIACENYPECKYIKKEKVEPEFTGENCPKCGSPMVFKTGRYGKFEACSNYPQCKYIKNSKKKAEPVMTDEVCPNCGSPVVIKKGRWGEFKACSNYPKCHYIKKEPKKTEEDK